MRHFVLPRAVALGPCGVVAATTQAALITLTGGAPSGAARLCRAVSLTVDVAAIAAGADQYLDAASRAQIEARACMAVYQERRNHCQQRSAPDNRPSARHLQSP